MGNSTITVNAYSTTDDSFTGHVTVTIELNGFAKTYERTVSSGVDLGFSWDRGVVSTAGVVQEAKQRKDTNGDLVSPAAASTISVSNQAALNAIIEMERLIKVDDHYGIALNNCADLVDQVFVAASLPDFPWGKGLSGKVDGPITLSLPGYIDQTPSELNQELRLVEALNGLPKLGSGLIARTIRLRQGCRRTGRCQPFDQSALRRASNPSGVRTYSRSCDAFCRGQRRAGFAPCGSSLRECMA